VVAISSAGEAEQEALSRLGVSLFLRKPVRYADLAGTVRFLLNSQRNGKDAAPSGSTPQG
jgi:hypothetical protein